MQDGIVMRCTKNLNDTWVRLIWFVYLILALTCLILHLLPLYSHSLAFAFECGSYRQKVFATCLTTGALNYYAQKNTTA